MEMNETITAMALLILSLLSTFCIIAGVIQHDWELIAIALWTMPAAIYWKEKLDV